MLNPADIHSLLKEFSLSPSRALGQNFLTDANTARRIARLAAAGPGTRIFEIGPGLGSLTLALAETGAEVRALEFDRHLIPALESVIAGLDSVSVSHGDALTFNPDEFLGPDKSPSQRWHCVSNLPYNVATPVVVRLLADAPQISNFVVMVQREVGERWTAPLGTRASGSISVRIAYEAQARIVAAIPRTVFFPPPRVDSVIVQLDRRDKPLVDVPDPEFMFSLVGAGFGQRRKTLRRSLRSILGDQAVSVLTAAGIDTNQRAENLDLDHWAQLARSAKS